MSRLGGEKVLTNGIGARLKEERNRLGYSQTKLAELLGTSKNTIIAWEKGTTSPTLVQISVLFDEGLNILYVLGGEEGGSGVSLESEESTVLSLFRGMPEDAQSLVLDLCRRLCETKPTQPAKPAPEQGQLQYVIEQVEIILDDEQMQLNPEAKARVVTACLESLQREGEITASQIGTAIRAVK